MRNWLAGYMTLEDRYDQQFKVVFDAIRLLMDPKPLKRKEIGFFPKAGKK
jgi:hypothetical protein